MLFIVFQLKSVYSILLTRRAGLDQITFYVWNVFFYIMSTKSDLTVHRWLGKTVERHKVSAAIEDPSDTSNLVLTNQVNEEYQSTADPATAKIMSKNSKKSKFWLKLITHMLFVCLLFCLLCQLHFLMINFFRFYFFPFRTTEMSLRLLSRHKPRVWDGWSLPLVVGAWQE